MPDTKQSFKSAKISTGRSAPVQSVLGHAIEYALGFPRNSGNSVDGPTNTDDAFCPWPETVNAYIDAFEEDPAMPSERAQHILVEANP